MNRIGILLSGRHSMDAKIAVLCFLATTHFQCFALLMPEDYWDGLERSLLQKVTQVDYFAEEYFDPSVLRPTVREQIRKRCWCPYINEPVCVSDGMSIKTWRNKQCLDNCGPKLVMLIYRGPCK